MFSECEVISVWKSLKNQKYEIISFLKNEDYVKYVILRNKQNGLLNTGKIISSVSKNELYYWPHLHHRSLSLFLECITINEFFDIYVSPYMKESLRNIINRHSFAYHSDCFNRKKIYIEDILWGLDYLHRKSLCLYNINDQNIFICEEEDKAIIADFSCLNKSHQGANYHFNIPTLYKAPELNNKEPLADPEPIEIWSMGILILEVFLSYMVPWGLINFDSSRAQEILSKIDEKILKVANYGSVISQVDINEFKSFVSCFLRKDPQNRFSAQSAAVTTFIQSTRQHFNRFTSFSEISTNKDQYTRTNRNTHFKQQYYKYIIQDDFDSLFIEEQNEEKKSEKLLNEFDLNHRECTITTSSDLKSDINKTKTVSVDCILCAINNSGENVLNEITSTESNQSNSPKDLVQIVNKDINKQVPAIIDNDAEHCIPQIKSSITQNLNSRFSTKSKDNFIDSNIKLHKLKSLENANFYRIKNNKNLSNFKKFDKSCQYREVKSSFEEQSSYPQHISNKNEVLYEQPCLKKVQSDSMVSYRSLNVIDLPSISLLNNVRETSTKNYYENINPVILDSPSKTETREPETSDCVNLKYTTGVVSLKKTAKSNKLKVCSENLSDDRIKFENTIDSTTFNAENNKINKISGSQLRDTVVLKITDKSSPFNKAENIEVNRTWENKQVDTVKFEDINTSVKKRESDHLKKTNKSESGPRKFRNIFDLKSKNNNHSLNNMGKSNKEELPKISPLPTNQMINEDNVSLNRVKQKIHETKHKDIQKLEQSHRNRLGSRKSTEHLSPEKCYKNLEFDFNALETKRNHSFEISPNCSVVRILHKNDKCSKNSKNNLFLGDDETETSYTDKDLLIEKKYKRSGSIFSYRKAVARSDYSSNDLHSIFPSKEISKEQHTFKKCFKSPKQPVQKLKKNFKYHEQFPMIPKVTIFQNNLSNKQKCEISKLLLQTENKDEQININIDDSRNNCRTHKSPNQKNVEASCRKIVKKKKCLLGHCFRLKKANK